MTHLLGGLASVEVEVDEGGEQAGGDQQKQGLQETILQNNSRSSLGSNLNLEVGAGSGCSQNLLDHRLVAVEQPEEEVDGEDGKVEGEEEHSFEEEGGQGDEDAGGVGVEVDHESQPGVVALHRVGGEAEEEGEGEHQEERHHQELHEELASHRHPLHGLLLCRGGQRVAA